MRFIFFHLDTFSNHLIKISSCRNKQCYIYIQPFYGLHLKRTKLKLSNTILFYPDPNETSLGFVCNNQYPTVYFHGPCFLYVNQVSCMMIDRFFHIRDKTKISHGIANFINLGSFTNLHFISQNLFKATYTSIVAFRVLFIIIKTKHTALSHFTTTRFILEHYMS